MSPPVSNILTNEESFGRSPITHVIFDFDGILVDTERLYSEANKQVLGQFGGTFTNELKAVMMGMTKTKAVEALLNASNLAHLFTVEQYMQAYDAKIASLFASEIKVLPGAVYLVEHLHSIGIPLAICTGSNALEFEQKTWHPDVSQWLSKIPLRMLCGSDPEVSHCKPHPEPYQILMRRFANDAAHLPLPASPENVLVFEDSVNGVRSALAAGCSVIMVPQREFLPDCWPESELRSHPNLREMLDSLADFQPEKYGFSPFPSVATE